MLPCVAAMLAFIGSAQAADPPEAAAVPTEPASSTPEATATADTAARVVPRSVTGDTRIQGRLYEGRRTPVVGASVVVTSETGGDVLYLTTSNDRGEARVLGVPDGDYRVEFRKVGYDTIVKNRVVVDVPLRAVLEVRMETGSEDVEPDLGARATDDTIELVGTVVDAEGAAVPEVDLRLSHPSGERDPKTARTGVDGRFAISGVEAGHWKLAVRGVGYLPIRAIVAVDRTFDVGIRVIPQPPQYVASPADLMPFEEPVPPSDWDATWAPVPENPGAETGPTDPVASVDADATAADSEDASSTGPGPADVADEAPTTAAAEGEAGDSTD